MKIDEEIIFDIYGTIVKGTFLREDGNLIYIKTTHDFITENIGEEQSVNKRFVKSTAYNSR